MHGLCLERDSLDKLPYPVHGTMPLSVPKALSAGYVQVGAAAGREAIHHLPVLSWHGRCVFCSRNMLTSRCLCMSQLVPIGSKIQ